MKTIFLKTIKILEKSVCPIYQTPLFNSLPTGKMVSDKRLRALMKEGGIAECGNAQNCVQMCPKKVPLAESIAAMGKDTTKQMFKYMSSSPDCD